MVKLSPRLQPDPGPWAVSGSAALHQLFPWTPRLRAQLLVSEKTFLLLPVIPSCKTLTLFYLCKTLTLFYLKLLFSLSFDNLKKKNPKLKPGFVKDHLLVFPYKRSLLMFNWLPELTRRSLWVNDSLVSSDASQSLAWWGHRTISESLYNNSLLKCLLLLKTYFWSVCKWIWKTNLYFSYLLI